MFRKRGIFCVVFLVVMLVLAGCSAKPKLHYFRCSEQTPEIIYSYFPSALSSVNYKITNVDTANNVFEATKPIKNMNTTKGMVTESIMLKVKFHFDTTQSEITQYWVRELNGSKKVKALTAEQESVYEKDVATLKEQMTFYCNPAFKGR